MENFKKYFNAVKPTKNSRVHHHNLFRSPTRKHQNQVARRYGFEAKKDHPLIDRLVKNNSVGRWPINALNVTGPNGILKIYDIVHTPNEPYSKAIKQTGIKIHYIPSDEEPEENEDREGTFFITRQKPKSK